MIFISVEEFFNTAKNTPRPTREEEKALAQHMADGDIEARTTLVRGYLSYVAAHVRRAPKEILTLRTVYACISVLEKGVDSFNFLQDGETFGHYLDLRLRQCIVRCLADST